MYVVGELEAEGGGNIKQELCVLSSQRLDRTPPKPNEVFFVCVCLDHPHDCASTYACTPVQIF